MVLLMAINIGNTGEQIFYHRARRFHKVDDKTNDKNYWGKDIDFIVTNPRTGETRTIEVKTDTRLYETGNLYAQQFETLTKKVDASMTSEQVKIAISTEMAKGTDRVSTSTGFTFDDKGLTISKSDSEIGTNINENGMKITKGGAEVLTADNTGVKARNLHATTYLIIGTNSRFEDYGSDRTGCFWIGG